MKEIENILNGDDSNSSLHICIVLNLK